MAPKESRRRIPPKTKTAVLVANGHTCCICRHPGSHVKIHHIDGNPRNNDPANLAVVCLNCHSRVTGDEGLGQCYSQAEVLEYKRRWEAELARSRDARKATVRESVKRSKRFGHTEVAQRNETRGREYLYIHHELARTICVAMGLPIEGERFEHDQLEVLLRELDKAGLLTRTRPKTTNEYEERPFVFERLNATKVFFPPGLLTKTLPSLRELAVWVSDPNPKDLRTRAYHEYKYDGTFLYLIGSFWDDQEPSGSFFSGCSALQAIANVIHGKPFLESDFHEPLGRRSF